LSPPAAATLLGEVRAGGAARLTFDGEGGEGSGGDAQQQQTPEGPDAAMEAAMLALIRERARKYEQDKAVSRCARSYGRARG
jgi:hypothetical protein